LVKVGDEFTPATFNDPKLTGRLAEVFKLRFGETNVLLRPPSMGGEDFGQFGRTPEKIPICMFSVGGVNPPVYADAKQSGKSLPSLHSALWAPDPEPTIKTGVEAMTAAVLELMKK